jgi:hypothetical protein
MLLGHGGGALGLSADIEWRKLRRPTLRSQLNQIRLWLRQGRTEAWIAHKLDISVAALEQFKRDHQLGVEPSAAEVASPGPSEAPEAPEPPEPEAAPPPPAEVFAGDDLEDEEELETRPGALGAEPGGPVAPTPPGEAEDAAYEAEAEAEAAVPDTEAAGIEPRATVAEPEDAGPDLEAAEGGEDEPAEEDAARPRRRRRGRRGGRRRGAKRARYEATFEHGEEGYGLRLDPAVADNPVYAKHWAGHRTVAVILEPDAITIRRVGAEDEPSD